MSVPCSLRAGPFVSNLLVKKRYLFLYVSILWISVIPIVIEFWLFWNWTWNFGNILGFYVFLPIFVIIAYFSLVFSSLITAKIFLVTVNIIHKPKTGVFLRDPKKDKDYKYWNIRLLIKKWPVWITHRFPFPFLDNLCFKVFGVKTTFSNSLFEGWMDTEFVECGKNVVLGKASLLQSSLVIGNLLIVKKTVVEDNVLIGSHSIVMPGTYIEKDVILAAHSLTKVEQRLKEGYIYLGIPAKKYKPNRYFEDDLESEIERIIDMEGTRIRYEELYKKQERRQVSYLQRRREKEEFLKKERERFINPIRRDK